MSLCRMLAVIMLKATLGAHDERATLDIDEEGGSVDSARPYRCA